MWILLVGCGASEPEIRDSVESVAADLEQGLGVAPDEWEGDATATLRDADLAHLRNVVAAAAMGCRGPCLRARVDGWAREVRMGRDPARAADVALARTRCAADAARQTRAR
jgi:hypothetical protein